MSKSLSTFKFPTKRFKALLWSSAAMFVAAGLDILAQEFMQWDPENIITIGVGLVFAQITKSINNWYSEGKL
ncbi:MAG: hypothetical protein V3T43_06135 [Nitrosomonadaceae bacterium]